MSLVSYAQVDLKPRGMRLGVDIIPPVSSLLETGRQAFEFHGDVQIDKFLINADYGFADVQTQGPNFRYSNSGSYMRFGADFNITHRNPFGDAIFVGFRYGTASFDESLRHAFQVPTWGILADTTTASGVTAGWAEMVGGLKARVKDNIFLGFTIRYRLANSVKSPVPGLETFEIPGFGRNGATGFGLSYHVMYRIPFRKPTPPKLDGLIIKEE